MPELAVVNSSPLIVLARAGVFELLEVAGDHVVVPAAVVREVNLRGPADPVMACLRSTGWLKVVDSIPIPQALQGQRLGPGETAVLAWALANHDTVAILDDQSARRAAIQLGVKVRGTIWLIVEAKRQGRIGRVASTLTAIRQAGLYVSDQLVQTALRLAGE